MLNLEWAMINILGGIWLQVIYEWSQIIIKFYIKAYSCGEQISSSFPFPKESVIAQTVSPSHAHLPGCSFPALCFTTQTPSVWGPESCHSSQHCWENPVSTLIFTATLLMCLVWDELRGMSGSPWAKDTTTSCSALSPSTYTLLWPQCLCSCTFSVKAIWFVFLSSLDSEIQVP